MGILKPLIATNTVNGHPMQSLDLQLARHASSLTYAALTPHALERAKVFLLDTLGVGIAGGSTPEIQPLLKAVRSW
ncbi:MAG: MmgE/PrpD family protein, partial [Zwartia sp.]